MSSLAEIFESEPHVVAAWLFGSVAKARATPFSDVDIAVLLDKDAPAELDRLVLLDRLARRLAEPFGISEHDVDVEPLNEQGIVFQYEVIRTGRLIYERDLRARRLFAWHAVMRYLDFRPTLEIFDRASGRKRIPRESNSRAAAPGHSPQK
jgi:predicted nucleotidyltransferase